MKLIEKYRERIAAIVPYYDEEGGNATRIYTIDGENFADRRTTRWVIRRMARVFSIDLEALRKDYGQYLGISQGVPLPISEDLVMVPLKLRQVIGKNDGAGGYVNICAVQKVEEYPDKGVFKSRIHLTGGNYLPCVFNCRTVERRFCSGEIARERYIRNHGRASFLLKENISGQQDGGGDTEMPPELLIAIGKLLWKTLKR
ncbi:MAG: hypothetical protein GX364_08425 [Firmicutes bacterium]|jgi:hypothetical protein|nr:hypothetical protein [Bacillota bacterium]